MCQAVLASMPDLDSGVAEHRLTVTSGQGHRDFQYRVAAVPTPVPLFGGRGMTRGNDLYLRLEVFTQTGSEDYDIMGLTRQRVIDDVIDRYEAHLAFLQYSTEHDYESVLTPPVRSAPPVAPAIEDPGAEGAKES